MERCCWERGEGTGGLWGWHPSSAPTYFLILLIQVFQKCIQLILINEAISILDSVGGTSTAEGHKPCNSPVDMGIHRPSPSTARGKPSSPTPNQSRGLPQPKPYDLGLFLAKLYLFGAVSHELAPYLVIEGKDGIELVRGQLHSLEVTRTPGYERGVGGTSNGNELFLLFFLAVQVVLCYLKLQKKVFLHRQKSEKQ